MISIVIADDEIFSREQLSQVLNWAELGFEIVGLFKDGSEVIEYLEGNSADVILSDIKMKHVSGLDVAKYVFENKLKTQVILLSGYKDFEYAIEAMRLNVFEYLLKPTTHQELYDVIMRVKEQYNESHDMEAVKKRAFVDLVQGSYDSINDIQNILDKNEVNISLKTAKYLYLKLIFINYDRFMSKKYRHGAEAFKNCVENIIRNFNGRVYFSVLSSSNGISHILALSDQFEEKVFSDTVDAEIKKIVSSFKLLFDLDATVETGEVISSYTKLSASCGADAVAENGSDVNGTQGISVITAEEDIKDIVKSIAYRLFSDIDRYPKAVLEAVDYIIENYRNDVSLNEVARHVHLNSVYFSRCFKKSVGKNFVNVVNEIKMETVMYLLKYSTFKVCEICEMLGYRNSQHFYRTFKAFTDNTPVEFRSKNKG